VRHDIAFPEALDHVDGLTEHGLPGKRRGKALADHVLVQVLAGTEREREAIIAQDGERGRELCNYRRVVAHRRAGHRCGEADPLSARSHCTEHRPRER